MPPASSSQGFSILLLQLYLGSCVWVLGMVKPCKLILVAVLRVVYEGFRCGQAVFILVNRCTEAQTSSEEQAPSGQPILTYSGFFLFLPGVASRFVWSNLWFFLIPNWIKELETTKPHRHLNAKLGCSCCKKAKQTVTKRNEKLTSAEIPQQEPNHNGQQQPGVSHTLKFNSPKIQKCCHDCNVLTWTQPDLISNLKLV